MRLFRTALLAAFVVFLYSQMAMADLIWGTVTHNTPSATGTQGVLFNPGAGGNLIGGSTYTLQGMTSSGAAFTVSTNNDDSNGVDHLYANTATQLLSNAVGSNDTSVDQLSFAMSGHTFTNLSMNLFGAFANNHSGGANDSVKFVVATNSGTFTHIFTGLTSGNTNNWILLTTSAGEYITSVSLDDTRFYALEDLQVAGLGDLTSALAAPEPASISLLGCGLLGVLGLRRKKR